MKRMHLGKACSKAALLLMSLVFMLMGMAAPSYVSAQTEEENMKESLAFSIDGTVVSVEWEDNASVAALRELVQTQPLEIQMSMYGGFEQVGFIGTDLPREDEHTVTESGDIVLYSGDQLVVFYGSNSWAYTRLGKITDKTSEEMRSLLSRGNVVITISAGE